MKLEEMINKVHCADCLEFMKQIPDKSIDLVLTDPPYGVNENYIEYEDNIHNLKKLIDVFVPEIRRIGKVVMITTGVSHMYKYPEPDWVLNWTTPAGTGCSKWGFCCWQPILVYGKDPYLTNGLGSRPDTLIKTESSVKYGHPCSKPIDVWRWILTRGSVNEGDLVLDPFLGSGTTAVACQELHRNFIGIEISPEYCKIAEERLKQKTLF